MRFTEPVTRHVNIIPQAPLWNVLIRPNQPFAVFYKHGTPGSSDVINDVDPGTSQNWDEDGDQVPDYAERVYNCLVVAHERYNNHYNINPDDNLRWLSVNYFDSISGLRETHSLYPVVIRDEDQWGAVNPVMALSTLMTDVPFNASYTQIDGRNKAGTLFRRDTGSWLYPGLENTIYHEMAHVYQAYYKAIIAPGDYYDNWTYEGTAVYVADQALVPECSLDSTNPPRISGPPSTDCRTPNIYERDSETRLSSSNTNDALFDRPWTGLTRDDGKEKGVGSITYSSVLMWYYAQAHLQAPGDSDVVRAFWRDRGGDDNAVEDWSSAEGFDGLSELYHHFMVDNYLQTLSYPEPGYENPYYDSWKNWGISNWYVQQSSPASPAARSTVFIRPNDVTTVAPTYYTTNRNLHGDDGSPNTEIEQLGTAYYMIRPNTTSPVSSTLEVVFRPNDTVDPYQVTFLDVTIDPSTQQPVTINNALYMNKSDSTVFHATQFGGATAVNRRVIIAVSEGERDGSGFVLESTLLPNPRPIALTNPFSPNQDTHKDTTAISYFLPPFPSTDPFNYNVYEIDIDAADNLDPSVFYPVARLTEPMSQTLVYTWTGQLENGTVLTDGEQILRFQAYEAPGGSPNGQVRTYTTTVTIDTQVPVAVSNLTFTPGTTTDSLSWTGVTTDTSPGGIQYRVFNQSTAITDTDSTTPFTTTTTTSLSIPHIPSSRYFAVVVEDKAGNRSMPVRLESDVGKIDVILVIDDSGSMGSDRPNYDLGIAENVALLGRLKDNDRIGVIGMKDPNINLPLTLVDSTTHITAENILTSLGDPAGDPPVDAMTWALDQFARPEIATDGRPHIIVVFSDGGEFGYTPLDRLSAAHPTVFAVVTPYGDTAPVQPLVDITNTATPPAAPESRMFAGADLSANFQTVGGALHGPIFNADNLSISPGKTETLNYPIDSRTREATIRVTWDPAGRTPSVKLFAPGSATAINPSSPPRGLSISRIPGEVAYSLLLPPLAPGQWKIQITNPSGGSTAFLSRPLFDVAGLAGMAGMPLLSLQNSAAVASTLDYQPRSIAAQSADDLNVRLETASSSSLTTLLSVTSAPGLELSILDAGTPVTGNTFVLADLTDQQGITHTLVLADDGTSGDSVANDGRYTAPFDPAWGTGLYQASILMRHFDQERGYIERTLERDIYVGIPDLHFNTIYWSDAPDQDGAIDPGDTISLQVELYNNGDGSATGIHGTLVPSDGTVHMGNATSPYPMIGPYAFGQNTNAYTFTVDPATPVGSTLTFEHRVTIDGTQTFTEPVTLQVGTPSLEIAGVRWLDSGTDDGRADPGDTVQLQVDVKNTGDGSAGNIQSMLVAPSGTTLLGNSTSEYPYIPAGASATNTSVYTFTVDPSTPPGTVLEFQQVITAGLTFTNTFRVPVGISQFGPTETYTNTSDALEIPDGDPNGVTDVISLSTSGAVGDINVHLNATHPLPSDLVLKLISPQGTEVLLSNQRGTLGSDFTNTTFDDAAATPVTNGAPPFSGTFRPEMPLSALNGEPIVGEWQLQATDTLTDNVGTIDSWSLDIRPLTAVCWPQGNDFCPPTVQVEPSALAIGEADGSATVTVTLDKAVNRVVTVYYYTSDGTAKWNTYPSDYAQTGGAFYFAPGETSKAIEIPIRDDQSVESDETFTLNLSYVDNANIGTSSTTITILDDDRKPTVAWASSTVVANEGDTVTMTVQLSDAARKPIQVSYNASDWSATAGSDYSAFSGTVAFAKGEISKTLTLSITNDTLPEPDEVFYLHLSNPVNATLGSVAHAHITIAANDCSDMYEPNDSAANAQSIGLGVTQTHAFCADGDEDWASFTAAGATTYTIETRNDESNVDTVMELYANDGTTLLAEDDDGGGNYASRIKFTADVTGTYYIKVRQYSGYGNPSSVYDLHVSDMSAATPSPTTETCADSFEPDGSLAQAQSIGLYDTQTHAFCEVGDTDWLSFTLDADVTYTISTSNLAHDVDTVLELYDSDGTTLLDQNDDAYGAASYIEFTPATSGTYYVRVRHASATWGDASYTYDVTLSEGYSGGGT